MSRKPIIALALGVALVVIGVLIVVLWPEDPSFQVKTSWLDERPSGPVRLCGGEDVTSRRRAVTDYNDKYRPGSRATYSEGSFLADTQQRYVDLIENGSDDCDAILLDVVYMKEFASKHLLYDMTPYLEQHDRQTEFDPRMLRTVEHDGRLWGVPRELDVGVLYYRADKVPRPPTSWQEVFEQAKPRPPDNLPGLRFQLGPYEGLTVVLLELAYSAGADPIITEDGKTARLDQSQVLEALTFLRNAVRERVIPGQEQEDTSNLEQYALGRARFLRGWPFVDAEIHKPPGSGRTPPTRLARQARLATAARTRILPLPPWKPGGESVGVLGGHNLVIPRSARNPSAALQLVDFMTSEDQVRLDAEENSQVPVLNDLADEFGLGNQDLLRAVKETNVIPRPSIPQYADVSTIISCGVRAILFAPADVAVRERLQDINGDVQSVLDGGSSDLKSRAC